MEVHCKAKVNGDDLSPSYGMVVDFGDIKEAYKSMVEPYVEHQDLNETLDLPEYTTEHIAAWIYNQLKAAGLPMHKVVLWEGKTSFACITNGDQLY